MHHHTLHPYSGAMIVCLLVLHKLRVVSQPGDSDSEHYIEQLLIEMEVWDNYITYTPSTQLYCLYSLFGLPVSV